MQTLRPLSTRLPNLSPRTTYLTTTTTTTFRPTNHPRTPPQQQQQQRRTFLTNPFASSQPQTITATRTLPYPSAQIYSIISDIQSYSTYFPYCRESLVTKLSRPAAADGKRYPEEAKLVIGFGDAVHEEFWSRVYCVPERVVEAVSGKTETTLGGEEIRHHTARPAGEGEDPTRSGDVVEHLLTRWTLRPVEGEVKTEVGLVVEFLFANPVYAALSQAAVPRLADKMIEAFEARLERDGGEVDR